MTCSPWQKLHLMVAAHDRLAFGCDFASTFLAEVEPALVIGSSTWHRWAIKSNSCLSDGSSLPANEDRHSRNVSESSFEIRRSSQCIVGHFNAWRACKCFVALSERSIALSLVMVGKSNMALTSLHNHALVVISLPENWPRDIVIDVRQFQWIDYSTCVAGDARRYWNLCVFESEALEWITELNVSKNGNLSYLPENVGRFSLGNRTYYYLIREHLRRTEKRWTIAMSAKGKWAGGFYRITHRTLPWSFLDRFRIHLMILDAIAHRYIPPNIARVSFSALQVEPLLTG